MTGGNMGSVPASYSYIRAAKYLGVAPWEFIERADGRYWAQQAIAIENAEIKAERQRSRRGKKQ